MNESKGRLTVYEIGYLIVSSVPDGDVPAEAEKVKNIIVENGGSVIADEAPHREHLSYTIRRKTVAGSYEKYDEAYFGWIKFEAASDKVEAAKKAVEALPAVLRMLLITTVRENTYLGKHAQILAAKPAPIVAEGKPIEPPASIEEMDKSIDEMVKEI